MSMVASAVAHSLLPEYYTLTSNQYVYIRSFTASQDQILQSLREATAAKDARLGVSRSWNVIDVDLKQEAANGQGLLQKGDYSGLGYMLSLANYETSADFDSRGVVWNQKLGLDSAEVVESLDEAVRRVVEEFP